MRYVWLVAGWISVALAAIGVALPLLPTVPFLLLAAFCFSRSSPRFHDWLVNHRTFGPPIKAWEEEGAISSRAKAIATLTIIGSVCLTLFLAVPFWAVLTQSFVLCAVLAFIWTRPVPGK